MALKQHNLGTVVAFEFFRTIKKKGFAIATLAIPVLLILVFALVYASNSSTEASADAQKNAKLSFAYTDASGIIAEAGARLAGGTPAPTRKRPSPR
jgi:ABC-2 type transport system permease protein